MPVVTGDGRRAPQIERERSVAVYRLLYSTGGYGRFGSFLRPAAQPMVVLGRRRDGRLGAPSEPGAISWKAARAWCAAVWNATDFSVSSVYFNTAALFTKVKPYCSKM